MLTLKSTFFLIIHTKMYIFAIHTGEHIVKIADCVSSPGKDCSRKEKVGWKKHPDFSPTQSHRNELQQTHVQSVRELKDINIRDAGSQCPIQDKI